jgi:hypothetical protein
MDLLAYILYFITVKFIIHYCSYFTWALLIVTYNICFNLNKFAETDTENKYKSNLFMIGFLQTRNMMLSATNKISCYSNKLSSKSSYYEHLNNDFNEMRELITTLFLKQFESITNIIPSSSTSSSLGMISNLLNVMGTVMSSGKQTSFKKTQPSSKHYSMTTSNKVELDIESEMNEELKIIDRLIAEQQITSSTPITALSSNSIKQDVDNILQFEDSDEENEFVNGVNTVIISNCLEENSNSMNIVDDVD